jgi:hypothetical protein
MHGTILFFLRVFTYYLVGKAYFLSYPNKIPAFTFMIG